MKKSIFIIVLGMTVFMLTGCTTEPDNPNEPATPTQPVNPDTPTPPDDPTPDDPKKTEIKISVDSAPEGGFKSGDVAGLFVVDYDGAEPGSLKDSGNRADNVKFAYSASAGTWQPDRDKIIYWPEETKCDFYLVYPYSKVSSVVSMQFSVPTDQTAESAYRSGYLMTGRTSGVALTTERVKIGLNPVLSHVSITLKPGAGITNEMIADAKVRINNLMTGGTLDIATGIFTSSGAASSISLFKKDGVYRGVVVPQSTDGVALVTVTIGDEEFTYSSELNFQSGKKYDINITVAKGSSGMNVDISPWGDEETYHGVVG